MTKEEFKKLLKSVKIATGMSEKELSLDMDYNEGYISQMKSRGHIPDKFVNLLKEKYLKNAAPAEMQDYDIGIAIKRIEAASDVMLAAMGELLAKQNGLSVTSAQKQLEAAVKSKLSPSGSSQ